MDGNSYLKKHKLITPEYKQFLIKDKKTGEVIDLGVLIEGYALHRINLRDKKKEIRAQIRDIFIQTESSIDFRDDDEDDQVELRYLAWKEIPDDLFDKIKEIYPDIEKFIYEDMDNGNVPRNLISYIISIKI